MSIPKIRAHLATVSLTDDDLDGDHVRDAVAELKTLIADEQDSVLVTWLDAEHYRLAVLYAAAKINKSKWGANTATREPHSRATIIRRFNEAVAEIGSRLDVYESNPQTSTTSSWLVALAEFRADPILSKG